ncbi:MAG TPA: pitrilysin family protein [Bacilli bacterium]|nr:pitrilysin family protein [Bacilli bacterium]
MDVIRKKINNIETFLVKTPKFKTISIQIVFANQFTEANASLRALLARVLGNSSKKYNNKKKAVEKSCDLYNAEVSVGYVRYYKTSLISFTLDVVNEKNLVNAKNLTKKAIAFLLDTIFNPNASEGMFSLKEFKEEKRLLKESMQKIYNNKSRFAFRRLMEEMCQGEIIGVNSTGTIADLEMITPESLYQEYLKMMDSDEISIYVVGDVTEKEIFTNLKFFDSMENKKLDLEVVSFETAKIKNIREIKEVQKIKQSKLVMGYRLDVNSLDPLHPALLVFSSMFGGLFSSNLFRVVREEHGLAYDIDAHDIANNKIFIITAGIDSDKYLQTTKLINEELDKYTNSNIDLALLEVAKESLINELQETEDSPYNYIAHLQNNYFTKTEKSITEEIQEILDVTAEDIKKVALGIKLDTIYFLSDR